MIAKLNMIVFCKENTVHSNGKHCQGLFLYFIIQVDYSHSISFIKRYTFTVCAVLGTVVNKGGINSALTHRVHAFTILLRKTKHAPRETHSPELT